MCARACVRECVLACLPACARVCVCLGVGGGCDFFFKNWCRCDCVCWCVDVVLVVNREAVEGRNMSNDCT